MNLKHSEKKHVIKRKLSSTTHKQILTRYHANSLLFLLIFLNTIGDRDANKNWTLIQDELISLRGKYIPKVTIAASTQSTWFTTHVKRCINKKKRLYSRAKLTASEDDWKRYREHAQICKMEIETAKDKFYNYDISNMLKSNSKKFWKVVSPCYDSKAIISIAKDGKLLSMADAATEFGNFFSSVFTDESPMPPNLPAIPLTSCMQDVLITPRGIAAAIDRLSANSAPGPDEICPKILKMVKLELCPLLSAIFQQSLDTGCVHDDWKLARVIPIFKSGDRFSPTNYRPIFLTSIAANCLNTSFHRQS